MSRPFEELNREFAKLELEFDQASDSYTRAVIKEEMRLLFREMDEALTSDAELADQVGRFTE